MRELWFIVKVAVGRLIACMVVCWIIYNPWLSIVTWLAPQFRDSDQLAHGWPGKLIIFLLVVGFVIGMLVTIRNSLGRGWTLLIFLLASLLAYIPFYTGYVETSQKHILYAAYFFVVPVMFAAALSAGYVVRYIKGTLLTQSVGGHVHATVQSHPGADSSAHHSS